jgi:hypothetical protein
MQEVVGGLNTAVIKVGPEKQRSSEKVKFSDGSGKVFNCNKTKYLGNASDGTPVFHEGRIIKVVYNLVPQSDPTRKPMRWIEDVGLPEPGEDLTWADKQPYQSGDKPGSGMRSNGEFRTPEQIMRGQSLECAVGFAKTAEEALEMARTFFYPYIFGEFEPKDDLAVAAATVAEELPVTPVEDDGSEFPF